jgi:hypothetical protein
MPPETEQKIQDVKALSFQRFVISADGELLVFEVHDKAGNKANIAIDWLSLTTTVQLFGRAAEAAAKARKTLGKSDDYKPAPGLSAQVVSTFQVSEFPANDMKLLSLQSPVGFRCDFAISTKTTDQLGRSLPRAIAEELLRDSTKDREQPN